MPARYDGIADWYDQNIARYSTAATPFLLRLTGIGPGRCLDLSCGTGIHLAALANAGWSVIGAPFLRRGVVGSLPNGLGESRGDGQGRSLLEGHCDTATPGSPGTRHRRQRDAPKSASQ